MYLARSSDGRRIPSTKEEKGYCQLTARQGEINEWHWSHKPKRACSYNKATSSWQYRWLSYLHEGGEWEVEVDEQGLHFDAIHRKKRLAIMLAPKLDLILLNSFINESARRAYKSVILFSAKALEKFKLEDQLLVHQRKQDETWTFFSNHASKYQDRTASIWMDLDQDAEPNFCLTSGVYNLFSSPKRYNAIGINPKPKPRFSKRLSIAPHLTDSASPPPLSDQELSAHSAWSLQDLSDREFFAE